MDPTNGAMDDITMPDISMPEMDVKEMKKFFGAPDSENVQSLGDALQYRYKKYKSTFGKHLLASFLVTSLSL